MNKTRLSVLFIASILTISLVTSIFVLAKPDTGLVPTTNGKADVPPIIPEHAIQVADNVFSLGFSQDVDGRVVEGIMFIHNKRENAKPPWAGGEKGEKGGEKCYEFMAKGVKWKSVEDYLVDPSNNVGLDESFVKSSVASDIGKWEDASGKNIFGNEIAGVVDGDDDVSPDNQNEVLFKNLGPTNTIAYTIVWGIFYGPPSGRELVEWDMVFNEDFAWSSNGDLNSMDFENIDTHEIGHAAGLSHPADTCTEETMYAYASLGETKKRDLNPGDIAGITELYA